MARSKGSAKPSEANEDCVFKKNSRDSLSLESRETNLGRRTGNRKNKQAGCLQAGALTGRMHKLIIVSYLPKHGTLRVPSVVPVPRTGARRVPGGPARRHAAGGSVRKLPH
jgi:hypothetical protein